jgi:DNA-binding NarL/FixJ family response regulator
MDLPFDRGRSLTALGVARRRARELRAARTTLEAAAAALDGIGSAGWAEQARLELARLGGRRRTEVLTATEQQVAQLVCDGLANKQIAQRLVVSTSTVEAHLTRIYRKLGVGSRTELARILAEQSVGLTPIPDGDAHP